MIKRIFKGPLNGLTLFSIFTPILRDTALRVENYSDIIMNENNDGLTPARYDDSVRVVVVPAGHALAPVK